MKRYIFLSAILCLIVLSYISQTNEEQKEQERYECWDGESHWYSPIYHVSEMCRSEFWQELKAAQERERAEVREHNDRDE